MRSYTNQEIWYYFANNSIIDSVIAKNGQKCLLMKWDPPAEYFEFYVLFLALTPKVQKCLLIKWRSPSRIFWILCSCVSFDPKSSYTAGISAGISNHSCIPFQRGVYRPYLPYFGSLSHLHGLEEVPVVHRPGPGNLPEAGWSHLFLFHVL